MIMKSIHQTCLEAAEQYGTPGNYMNGANIAGFVKVVDAMIDQGVVYFLSLNHFTTPFAISAASLKKIKLIGPAWR
jgi:beta-glucosidase/6-phospho-beta-glucosidase/beta-galactosidase